MKIFFYSTYFAPSVGGIERMAELLCREFTHLGHDVVLATLTPGNGDFPFEVVRRPSFGKMWELLRWSDIHIQANVSLKVAYARVLAAGRMFYRHGNVYQRDDGTKGPLEHIKTALARVTPGIANSTYTAARTGAAHVVLNAYDDDIFGPPPAWDTKDRDLVFLGRLVSQKGCDTLVEALGLLTQRGLCPDLTIIGDGPDSASLAQQVARANLQAHVRFVGLLKGHALADMLARHRVMVVPSRYEEPFGIVALEGLASGCVPIVSERGGLVDAIAGHGITFANGDATELADCLEEVLDDMDAARVRLNGVDDHLARCRSRQVAAQYIDVFQKHLERRP